MVWYICSVVSDSLQPHGLQPPSSSVHGISQARRACHFFLQGVFLTQGLNPCLQGLLLSRRLLYCWTTGEVPKFHTLLCKCSHCFATEDTSIFNNKTPWESHSWQCQSKSQNYTNEGLMQENYELFALLAVLGKSAHGQTRGGLVPGCGQETRDNRYWCLAMFCPSVSAHISAQLGVLSINSESQVVSAKSCFVHIAVCMWQLGAFTCTRCCLGPRWALPLSIFMGLTSVTRLPPRCPLWILANVCPNCLYLRTAGLSPPTRVPLGLWAVEGPSCEGPRPCGALLLLLWPSLALPSQVRDTAVTCCSADTFQMLCGPPCVHFFCTCSGASSQDLPMHLPPVTEMRKTCTVHIPLSHGKDCWNYRLTKDSWRVKVGRGFIEQSSLWGRPSPASSGPMGLQAGLPRSAQGLCYFCMPAIMLCFSLCSPAFFSVFPMHQICFNALLSHDSSGPSEISRGVPRPWAHESVPESSWECQALSTCSPLSVGGCPTPQMGLSVPQLQLAIISSSTHIF